LAQNPNDLFLGKSFLHLASMCKNNMKTNQAAGYTFPSRSTTGAVWDSARWDDPSATWVGNLATYNKWNSVAAWPGSYTAVVVSISATADTTWTATDLLLTPGGPFA